MPIGVTPFGLAPSGSGRILARTRVSSSPPLDFGNASGWANLAVVIAAIKSGNTVANVHADDGIASPSAGPGDFLGAEIRGRIRVTGRDWAAGGHVCPPTFVDLTVFADGPPGDLIDGTSNDPTPLASFPHVGHSHQGFEHGHD